MRFVYFDTSFSETARLLTETTTASGHIDRYEFNFIEDSELEHVREEYGNEDADLSDGIPAIDDYIHPDTVIEIGRNERRIDTTDVHPVALKDIKKGDIAVFTSDVCGNLVAEVEISGWFEYDDGVFEFETEDGFNIGFDERPSSDVFTLLGTRSRA